MDYQLYQETVCTTNCIKRPYGLTDQTIDQGCIFFCFHWGLGKQMKEKGKGGREREKGRGKGKGRSEKGQEEREREEGGTVREKGKEGREKTTKN